MAGPDSAPTDSPFDLLLIGPRGVGKTSVAAKIARETGRGVFHLDAHCHEFYLEDPTFRQVAVSLGVDVTSNSLASIFDELGRRLGSGCLTYLERLHLLAVRRTIATVSKPILDLGSGHGSFVMEANQNSLQELLAPHPVVCLWPSADFSRSTQILLQRNGRDHAETARALRAHKGRQIARHVIYTEEDNVEIVAFRVIDWIRNTSARS